MSMAEVQMKSSLSATSEITALVGDRIYPINVPNGQALPAIAFRRSNTEYHKTIHPNSAPAADVVFDVVCAAESAIEAVALADAVELASDIDRQNRIDDYDAETGIYATVVTVSLLNQ